MSAPALLRILLLSVVIILALLAIFYLIRRRLTWLEFCTWGLLALLLPILGPIVVIASRPGEPH
ncbi:MAG: hypothetical protein GYA59_06370 [Chloroflexi bacterium]|nr:hypothetical protein [Chloroflexota bacterium]